MLIARLSHKLEKAGRALSDLNPGFLRETPPPALPVAKPGKPWGCATGETRSLGLLRALGERTGRALPAEGSQNPALQLDAHVCFKI